MAAQPSKRRKGRLLGYARVSTYDQDLNLQRDALKKHGCREDRIFVDQLSRRDRSLTLRVTLRGYDQASLNRST